MTDPRSSIINERTHEINTIIAISSGKGGVGKSLVASTLALALREKGFRVGLFDLDFTSPSTHLILDIKDVQPVEDKGVVPPETLGLKYMSIVYYSKEHVTPLRGIDVSNVLIELLSVTRWGKLDFLILDMPPGISDTTLDLIRLIKKMEFIIVTTPSALAFETVQKLVDLLKNVGVPIKGIIENMKMNNSKSTKSKIEELHLKFLEEIPYDLQIEESIGDVDKLMSTAFANKIRSVATKVAEPALRKEGKSLIDKHNEQN